MILVLQGLYLFYMNKETTEELKKRKDAYVNKIFWLGLQVALIFALPAVGGALIGKRLKEAGKGDNITIFILIGTFIFSWIIVVIMYNRISKKIKSVEEDLRIAKEKENK